MSNKIGTLTTDRVSVCFNSAIKRRRALSRLKGAESCNVVGIVGEIKERQLAGPCETRLKSRCIFHLVARPLALCLRATVSLVSVATKRAWSGTYIALWRTSKRHECRRVFLHLPPNKRDMNRVNYTSHLLAVRLLRFVATLGEKDANECHLANVPPLVVGKLYESSMSYLRWGLTLWDSSSSFRRNMIFYTSLIPISVVDDMK